MTSLLERKEINTDILVVGGGGAGAMAAIKAMEEGADVLVVTKGPYPAGNTSIALAGFGVALGNADPRDNPQVHFDDIIRVGKGLNNRKLVRTWVNKIIEITAELDTWGIDLIREGDKFAQRPWAEHTYPRMVHHHWTTGKAVTQCLRQKSEAMGIKALPHTTIGGLLTGEEGVVGAWGVETRTGQFILVKAKAVVLATGGMGHLFPITDNVAIVTGEGYSQAFRAGAELMDMEFCHFLPSPCYPEEIKTQQTFLRYLREVIDYGGVRFYNGLGERFLKAHYPDTPLKDIINEDLTRSIGLEMCEGRGSAHGGVYVDFSDVPKEILKKAFSKVWNRFERSGIDLSYQPIEMAPAPHDFLGGVRIDETGRTNVPGLFAAGEATGGSHGASRIGGSALAEALAFGAIAGTNGAQYAGQFTTPLPLNKGQLQEVEGQIEALLSREEGIDPSELKRKIQAIAHRYLNAVRNEEGLNKALQKMEHMEQEELTRMSARGAGQKESATKLSRALEVDGQVELVKVMATAALLRTESRGGDFGGHYRSEYPSQDDENWLKNIVLKKEEGSISYHTVPPVMEEC